MHDDRDDDTPIRRPKRDSVRPWVIGGTVLAAVLTPAVLAGALALYLM